MRTVQQNFRKSISKCLSPQVGSDGQREPRLPLLEALGAGRWHGAELCPGDTEGRARDRGHSLRRQAGQNVLQ